MDKMKASAIAAVLGMALAGTAQADGPKVYGKVNVSYQFEDTDADNTDNWQLRSNASRVGVKGELPAGAVTGFYKVEFEVDVADNAGGIDKGRNQIAGVKGEFGKVFFGRHDTPVKVLGKVYDQFNDYKLGDIKTTVRGENRLGNTLSYVSPKMEGVQAWLMWIPGEAAGTDNDGPADSISASVKYAANGLELGLGYDSEVSGRDTLRLVASFETADFEVGALFQQSDDIANGSTDEETSFGISGAVKLDSANKIKAQYLTTDEDNNDADTRNQFSLGFDHKLDKKSKVFAFITATDTDVDDSGKTNIGVGLEHKF